MHISARTSRAVIIVTFVCMAANLAVGSGDAEPLGRLRLAVHGFAPGSALSVMWSGPSR